LRVPEELLAQLVDAPSPDAYLVYADLLQERGDPQGELIALAVHAELAGQLPGERQQLLQSELAGELLGRLANVSFGWKSGFVDEITLRAGAINAAVTAGLFERSTLALTRSVRVRRDLSSKHRDASLERLANSAIARGLTRLQLAGLRYAPTSATLATVLEKCPRLVDLGWIARGLDFDVLESCPRLERLALWDSINEANLARLVSGPWRLQALIVNPPRTAGGVPSWITEIVAGTRFPELVELGLLSCGFENRLLGVLAGSSLATRLRVLALAWSRVDADAIQAARATLAKIELDYALPATERDTMPDAYWLARHYRVGLHNALAALPHAKLATTSNPSDYFAWAELGYANEKLERDAEALIAFDQAIAVDPTRWHARIARARALRNLGRRAEAEHELLATLERDPTRVADTHARLGQLYAGWNRIADARASFGHALELAADDAARRPYTVSLVECLLGAEDVATARAVMEEQRPRFGDDPELRRLDAVVHLYEGDASRALDLVRMRPATYAGEDGYLWDLSEAAALLALGRMEEAHARYQRIVEDSDCPSWIGPAWLGQTLSGADPFVVITGVTAHEVTDQLAVAVQGARQVHDTRTHPLDRFYATTSAIAADLTRGRSDRARSRIAALKAELATAGCRACEPWLPIDELVRATSTRLDIADAALLRQTYLLVTGRTTLD
jgi:uncharacterized protein (TIGR02996 family)